MKAFAQLFAAIDETNKTNEKVAAMAEYFRSAPAEDAAYAVSFLVGRRPKRLINSTKLSVWAAEMSEIPMWLFGECYDAVGDLAETIASVLPDPPEDLREAQRPLHQWVERRLLPIGQVSEEEQREALRSAWCDLDRQSRFVFNKLITGEWRVGVSQDLVVRALSHATGVPVPVIAHRLMGSWLPTPEFYRGLFEPESEDTVVSRPYPFCLAHPLEAELESLGPVEEWHAEWKWDGIRAQLIRRQGQSFIWSRGEDLITERFPEVKAICDLLPEGTVVDGEILAWAEGRPMKFLELQKRIGRKTVSKKILQDVPVVLVAFDLLEYEGRDVRECEFRERRGYLEEVVRSLHDRPELQMSLLPEVVADSRLAVDDPDSEEGLVKTQSRFLMSSTVEASSWDNLAQKRQESRSLNVEGLMLKRLDSPYLVGRKKGLWWKWKIEPLTVDAVMIYAQRGHGKRASLYTDYTFGVWDQGKLVPFAKAYSGLSDEEIRRVDSWVRRNTLEKYGPVRTVKPELVMELAFEAIQLSSRHKSGIAVRFPRISRWRHDKKIEDADTLEGVKEFLKGV